MTFASSADGVLLRLMNNDKGITNRSTMLSLQFVDTLDRIGEPLNPFPPPPLPPPNKRSYLSFHPQTSAS
jgi:hypothetical protein